MKKILTLCIIHQDARVLLGMKKRGFGMGKWNGFGGKVEAGESIEAAAKREVFEEVGLEVKEMQKLGVLDFSWQAKPDDVLQVHIFKCTEFSGEPKESEEMKPQWFNVNEIPLGTMWPDDAFWMPLFLANKKFSGSFMFDEQTRVVGHKLQED